MSKKYSKSEIDFIITNHNEMTDAQIAKKLKRSIGSVKKKRKQLNLIKADKVISPKAKKHRIVYFGTLDDQDKRLFILDELRKSSTYRQMVSILTKDDIEYYEEKWVSYLAEGGLESITAFEKDTLHSLIFAQIRIFQLQKEEMECWRKGKHPTQSAEIKTLSDTIAKCRESLFIERKQRITGTNDIAKSFCSIIQELKSPASIRTNGIEDCKLKFLAELEKSK